MFLFGIKICLNQSFFFVFQNFLRAKFVICLTFNERGDLITGDSNGTIYVFGDGGNKITNFIKHGHDVRLLIHVAFLKRRNFFQIFPPWNKYVEKFNPA